MTARRTYSQIETETTTCSHAVKFVIAICGELRQSRRRKICKTPFHDDVRRHSRQRSPAVWLTISEPFVCASMRCNKKKMKSLLRCYTSNSHSRACVRWRYDIFRVATIRIFSHIGSKSGAWTVTAVAAGARGYVWTCAEQFDAQLPSDLTKFVTYYNLAREEMSVRGVPS